MAASIADIVAAKQTISFEFFPPQTSEADKQLKLASDRLSDLNPDFVSVTTGAGGSAPDRTRDTVADMQQRHSFPVMPHLTCMQHSRAAIRDLLDSYASEGICNILALAGDPPETENRRDDILMFASQLAEEIRAHSSSFAVGVAAHPEVHPRSENRESDRRYLAEKLRIADFAITQFFFDISSFLCLREELDRLGCRKPLIAGIMPVGSPDRIARFAEMNGTWIDRQLWDRLDSASREDRRKIAAEYAAVQCRELLAENVSGLHLYTLNRSGLCADVLADLDV